MKKGFTIIELLATIALMLLIVSIIVPSIIYISRDVKESQYEALVESIIISAKEYGEDNINNFVGNNCLQNGGSILKVSDLLNAGYLKGNNGKLTITDPRSNTSMNNMSVCTKYISDAGRHKIIACLCTTNPCDCSL